MADITDVPTLMWQIEGIKHSLAVSEVDVVKYKKALGEVTKELVEMIKNGATTGDPIHDLVIQAHGVVDEALTEKYRLVDNVLKGKKGEFVLLSYPGKVVHRYHSHGRDYVDVHCYRLGVLEEEGIVFAGHYFHPSMSEYRSLSIPISRYVDGAVSYLLTSKDLKESLAVKAANIFALSITDCNPPSLLEFLIDKRADWSRTLVVGDVAVRKWLEKNHMPVLYKGAADALSKLVLEPTDETD